MYKKAIKERFQSFRNGEITINELEEFVNTVLQNVSLRDDAKLRDAVRTIYGLTAKVEDLKEHCQFNYALMLEKHEKLCKAEARIKELEGDA